MPRRRRSGETAELTGPLVRDLAKVPNLVVHRLNSGTATTPSGHRIKLCRAGTPDLLVHHGAVLTYMVLTYIETKAPGGKLSAVQVAEQRRLRLAGAWVVTVETRGAGLRAALCRHASVLAGVPRRDCEQCGAWTL